MRIFSSSPLPSSWIQGNALASATTRPEESSSPALQQTQLTLGNAASLPDTSLLRVTQVPASLSDVDVTYGALGQAHAATGQLQIWEQTPNDAISQLMARNANNNTAATRLSGLGSALLQQLGNGVTHYQQTVVNTATPSSRSQIQTKANDALINFQNMPSAQLELQLKTRSGATVTLRIVDQQEAGSGGTGTMAEIQVDGTLSAEEQKAVQALAGGFEQAIQGLANDDTQVYLEQLGQFDSTLITSLALKANLYGRDAHGVRYQKLGASFKANAGTREIKLSRPDGQVSMSIDLQQPAMWGSATQKAKAVDKYLAGIDQAATRGHADQNLLQMFKSTFAALTASYGSQASSGPSAHADALREEDASWLTGLADFKAQMTATPRASNPRKLQELDRFQYTVDQTTMVAGVSVGNRSVTQAQNAHLSAAYHQSLFSPKPPTLDSTTASQNYYYMQVEDSASTQVHLQYDKYALIAATLTQLVEHSLRTQKFEHNKQVQDNTASSRTPRTTDLLPMEQRLQDRETRNQISAEEKQQMLAAWNGSIFEMLTT